MRLRHDGRYLFGRVVLVDPLGPTGVGECVLIYVYRYTSMEKVVPPRTAMKCDALLIPPEFVNRLGWSRGYWETLETIPLAEDELLTPHIFDAHGRLVDQDGFEVSGAGKPVGSWGLGNYLVVDDLVSEELGIPLAMDRPAD